MKLNHNNDKYTFFDKTADAKFQAYGITLDECFKNSQEAIMSVMYNIEELIECNHDESREIIVQGETLETLLYHFLEEVVFLMSAEFFVGLVDKIQIIHKEEEGIYKLKAILTGTQALNLEGHGEVKAVTYNEMYVKFDEDKDKYFSQVVVDI
jgi:SHS2 domain-containing protein